MLTAVSELLSGELVQQDLVLQPAHARLRSKLYARGAVQGEEVDENGQYHLKVRLARSNLLRILAEEGLQSETDYLLGTPAPLVEPALHVN